MTTIHPHWDATESDASVTPTTPARAAQTPVKMTRVQIAVPQGSRRPAAILGVLAVIAVGATVVTNLGSFVAQVAPVPVVIRITKDGASPKNVSATPGQPVTWKNGDKTARTISSDLQTPDGPVHALVIPSGSSATVTVSLNIAAGTYAFTDDNKQDAILGKISISKKAVTDAKAGQAIADAQASSTSSATVAAGDSSTTQATSSTASAPILALTTDGPNGSATHGAAPSASSAPSMQTADTTTLGGMARNPHTVSAGGAGGSGLPATADTLHGGAPLLAYGRPVPYRVAKTGPEIWIVSALSLLAFALVTRSALKRVE